ncbi:hypothetical protein [Hydrogenimonas sp. SS33]|uniref:hypothetical protein n=1 Tax=Hydrogenimonas leucolamina TaxID=2954236 RepID=UPI00336C2828
MDYIQKIVKIVSTASQTVLERLRRTQQNRLLKQKLEAHFSEKRIVFTAFLGGAVFGTEIA